MNILGMGSFELLIVFLVAFIFLGPSKMIETAKNIGKMLKNAKDIARDMQEIILDEEKSNSTTAQDTTSNFNNLTPVKFNNKANNSNLENTISENAENDIENADNKN